MGKEEAIVRSIFAIISREKEISQSANYINNDVEIYRDNLPEGQGLILWIRWVSFLHMIADRKMQDLELREENMVVQDNTIEVLARWHGKKDGQCISSEDIHVRYQIEEGRVSKIWSYTTNYTFIHGNSIMNKQIFKLLLLRLLIFSRLNKL
jgi:hypothetical protein